MNIANTSYLIGVRDFPKDVLPLSNMLSRTYIDIANAVNTRTIGSFLHTRNISTGETWWSTGNVRYQTLRRIYYFTTTANINIGFKLAATQGFTRMYGTYTDGTNWYGIPATTNVAIVGQLGFYVAPNGASTTSDVITFTVGAGAPVVVTGTIVLEWLTEI